MEAAGSSSGHDNKGRRRHSKEKIEEMERIYSFCPNPDATMREDIGRRLELDVNQVQFWFQNRRIQSRALNKQTSNIELKSDNEKLRAENQCHQETLSKILCSNCKDPAQAELSNEDLMAENARIREQIDRLKELFPHIPFEESIRLDLGMDNAERELSVAALNELVQMAETGEPLWLRSIDGSTDRLNENEYLLAFLNPNGIWPKPLVVKSEASRETAVVMINRAKLVEILMDEVQWSSVFSNIVGLAQKERVLSTGEAGNFDGALQVMTAAYQVSAPLVPCRVSFFLRYCKQISGDTWAVVDLSLDDLYNTPGLWCKRRPSGCLIQEMPNGYSKVVWVEHVEIHDDVPFDITYRNLVETGLGFGAKRWVATLGRQCERIANEMSDAVPRGISLAPKIRKNMMKVSERLVRDFWVGVRGSPGWRMQPDIQNLYPGEEPIMASIRRIQGEPGRPKGNVSIGAISTRLPFPPTRVFGFLRDLNSRNLWDILLNSGSRVQELTRIPTGSDPGNLISLLRLIRDEADDKFVLQETITDSAGSYLIYSMVDYYHMDYLFRGGDLDEWNYSILPSGVVVLPDGSGQDGGSLLTVSFQAWDGESDAPPVDTPRPFDFKVVGGLAKETLIRIKTFV